jgi:hypothetical protein
VASNLSIPQPKTPQVAGLPPKRKKKQSAVLAIKAALAGNMENALGGGY